MKKNNWEEKFDKKFGYPNDDTGYFPYNDVKEFIKEEIEKAEERGFKRGKVYYEEYTPNHDCESNGCVPSESVVEDLTSGGTLRYTVAGDTCKYCGKLV